METLNASQTLLIFTNTYPYGAGESFIENELIQLSKKVKTIKIFPLSAKGAKRELPVANAETVNLFGDDNYKRAFVPFAALRHLSLIRREFQLLPSAAKNLKTFRYLSAVLTVNLARAAVLKDYLEKNESKDAICYSFWTDDWATVLSLLKKEGVIKQFTSRVHGYDLYEERWPGNFIPFRELQLEQVSRIYAVSQDGLNYLRKTHKKWKDKFYLLHLNVTAQGTNPFDINNFTIVSCSSLIPLKRVGLIAKAVKQLPFKSRWIHFGDGPEMTELKAEAAHIPLAEIEFRGHVTAAELTGFYKTTPVNVFIHVSETEGGVPLVLQEAASFGIPLIGTHVGGIPEIVNDETGILVEKNITPIALASQIVHFRQGEKNTAAFRENVKHFWKENFDAERNVKKLYAMLGL